MQSSSFILKHTKKPYQTKIITNLTLSSFLFSQFNYILVLIMIFFTTLIRRRSRSPISRHKKSRSPTPRRHKRRKSRTSSLSPVESPTQSITSNALSKSRKEEEEKKRYIKLFFFFFFKVEEMVKCVLIDLLVIAS